MPPKPKKNIKRAVDNELKIVFETLDNLFFPTELIERVYEDHVIRVCNKHGYPLKKVEHVYVQPAEPAQGN